MINLMNLKRELMVKLALATAFVLDCFLAFAEPNCQIYKMENNQVCYEACVLAVDGGGAQGSRQSQLKFDSAIAKCPTLDYAYMEKAVPYLKRGDFITWKKLIDKAVELNPTLHLGYRGWCRYQFLRDYRGAIRDLQQLETLLPIEIGYSQNGDYHLSIAKALCYKALGEKQKAIAIIEAQLAKQSYSVGLYDYFHLGVLKMECGDEEGAIEFLNKSIAYNDYFAEPYFCLSKIYKRRRQTELQQQNLLKAKAYYQKGYRRKDPYTHPLDKVYFSDIEREMASISKQ